MVLGRWRVIAVALVAVLAVAGCGSGKEPQGWPSASASDSGTDDPGSGGGGTKVINWVLDLGPSGGPNDAPPEHIVQGALADGRCADAAKVEGQLTSPYQEIYGGLAAACLAAFHGRSRLWGKAVGAATAAASRLSGVDCYARIAYDVLNRMVTAYRAHPDARFVKWSRVKVTESSCPRIVSIDPTHGPLEGGYPLKIAGVNLPHVAVIRVGRNELRVRTEGGRSAVIIVPPGDPDFPATFVNVEGGPTSLHYEAPKFSYDVPKGTAAPTPSASASH